MTCFDGRWDVGHFDQSYFDYDCVVEEVAQIPKIITGITSERIKSSLVIGERFTTKGTTSE